ncbi:MAG: choice-of-anchor D domain-containing protein [Terriglobia bacterium]
MRRKVTMAVTVAGIFWSLGGMHLGRAQGQRAEVRSRIVGALDDDQRIVLTGSTHPLAQARFDQGAAPDHLQLDHVLLVLKRTPEQQAELDALLQAQQTLGSADYHEWLTPQEFGERFGPSPDDISQITAWLEAHGFRVNEVPAGRGAIDFSGTAGQVREVFHTSMHRFVVRGREHWANASDPEIPAALAEVVAGVANLDSFFAQPQSVRSSQTFPFPAGKSPQPANSQGLFHNALAPQDFGVIYNLNPLYQAGINGSGAAIAVVGRSNIDVQDVADFRRLFGLPTNPLQVVVNGPDPGELGGGEELEAVLDNSWAGATAPNATINFVVTGSTKTADGILLSEQYIINHNLADVMTESFSLCEAGVSQAYANYLSLLAQQAAAQGISYFVSSGNSGASGCDSGSETSATGPLSVNVLGSSPFITMVGGTQFNQTVGKGPYWDESNISAYYLSALSYIPEKVWNSSCSVAQCNSSANLWSAGGGVSQYFQKPSWQTGVAGIPNNGWRDVPDVSMAASSEHDPYLLCIDGSCSQSQSEPAFTGVGGTSAATSAFAGIMALVKQNTDARQGQANLILYQLAAAEQFSGCDAYSLPGAACIFNDVTDGNNSVPGGQGYGTSNPSYEAGVGYDLATGLGSVNAANLVNHWGSGTTPSPIATLQHGGLAFGNQAVGTTSSAQTVRLTNSGRGTLSITSIGFTGTNAHQFAQTNSCGSSLSAGASCAISVTFAPTAVFSPSASLTVTDNAFSSPQTLIVSGTAAAAVSLSPASISFGNQTVGTTSSAQTVTLTNAENRPLSISSINLTGANPTQFAQTGNCGTSLNSGANCTISVTFAPATASSQSASLTVTDSAPGSPQSVSLTGTGVGVPAVSLSPSSVAFGNQTVGTTSSAQTVTLTNTGTATLSITSIGLTGANPTQFAQTGNCGTSLNAGANCTISVTFAPTTASSQSASLTVADSAPGSPQSVSLTGAGVGVPAVSLSQSNVAFGNQTVGTTSSAQTVTLTNTGTAALSITSIGLTGANPTQFAETGNCGTSLNAGANCTISVTFRPTVSSSQSASLTVTDNASGSPHSVSLTGTGTPPPLSLSPATIAFGTELVGTTSPVQTVTVTNTSNGALSITGIGLIGTNSNQFSQSNACGASLSAGASCTIFVTFDPTASLPAAATLMVWWSTQ